MTVLGCRPFLYPSSPGSPPSQAGSQPDWLTRGVEERGGHVNTTLPLLLKGPSAVIYPPNPSSFLPYRQTHWSLLYKGETASTHTRMRLRLRDFSCQDLNNLSNLVFFTIKVFSASASKTQPPAEQPTPQDLVVFCVSTSCRRHSFRVDLKLFIFCHIWDCGRFSFRSHFGCFSNELMSQIYWSGTNTARPLSAGRLDHNHRVLP